MPRPISPKERKQILRQVTGGWRNLARDAASYASNVGGFVASSDPITPPANVLRTLNQWSCRVWARRFKDDFPVGANAINEIICGEYLDSINENPGNGSLGGLRKGILSFRVTITGGATAVVVIEDCAENYAFTFNDDASLLTVSWCLTNANQYPTIAPPIIVSEVVFTLSDPISFCIGTGDRTYTPPGQTPNSPALGPSISVPIPGIGPVDVTVDFDDKGQPVVCIPALEVCTTIDTDVFGDDAIPANTRSPGDIGEPSEPVEDSSGDDLEGQAPEGSVIGALKVELITIPASAKQFEQDIFRGVVYAYLGVEDGLDHDTAGAMITDGQIILPELDNLTHWRVSQVNGYKVRVTPYYVKIDPVELDEE